MVKAVNYKQLSEELEQIVTKLSDGELDIDEAIPAYERGLKLVEQIESYLTSAQNKVTELQAKRSD